MAWRVLVPVAVGALTIGLLGGCDRIQGGRTETAASSEGTSRGEGAQATVAATAAATAPSTPVGSSGGQGAAGRAAESDAYKQLRSYRYAFKMTAENVSRDISGRLVMDLTGAYVAPDRSQIAVNASIGGLTVAEESVSIGTRSWVKQGSTWTEGPSSFGSSGFTPNDLFGTFKSSDFQGLQSRKERVNNVATVRYTFDKASLEALNNLNSIFGGTAAGRNSNLPQSISGDIWVSEDGNYPVKMVLKMSGLAVPGTQPSTAAGTSSIDLSFDLTDINSTGIRIDPPR